MMNHEFSLLYRITSALAGIAISHQILFCARVVALSEKGCTIQYANRK